MIKHAEIYELGIEGEIRFLIKVYIDREEVESEDFACCSIKEAIKYALSAGCIISNYFDMTETEGKQ